MFVDMPKMRPSPKSGQAASGVVHRKVHAMLLQLVICPSQESSNSAVGRNGKGGFPDSC